MHAYTYSYSDVLEDLQKDTTYNASDYPILSMEQFVSLNSDEDTENDVDYVSVIHIGESEHGELFIYTYQPLNETIDITATSVNISLGRDSKEYGKYELRCLSSNTVFKKYLVENFTVPSDVYRYYNISEIERPFNNSLDEGIDETITNYVAHTVGQTWCCYYLNDNIVYEMTTLDVVEITPTLTDFIYYENGVTWGSLIGIDSGCYGHYIAFNVENYDVDKIYDADIVFKYRKFRKNVHTDYILGFPLTPKTSYTYPEGAEYLETKFKITDEQKVEHKGEGLFAKSYSWHRIMTANEFVENLEAQGGSWGSTTEETLRQSQFVFAFKETDVAFKSFITQNDTTGQLVAEDNITEGTEVAQIDILRLHFVSEGRTYNLGVVMDTTSADETPGGVADGLDFGEMDSWWQKLVALILGGFLLLLLWPFIVPLIKGLIKLLFRGLGYILGAIFSILTIPIRLIFRRK